MTAVGATLSDRIDELTADVQAVIVELIPELREAAPTSFAKRPGNIETALEGLDNEADSTEASACRLRRSSTPRRSLRQTWLPPP